MSLTMAELNKVQMPTVSPLTPEQRAWVEKQLSDPSKMRAPIKIEGTIMNGPNPFYALFCGKKKGGCKGGRRK